jgi:MYXO-CTERM domain-containing protein
MKKALGAVVVSAAVLLGEARPAQACGGCFHGPTASPMTVDAHRMVLSISPTATTLWDQIVYGGEPNEFAWVLPVGGEAEVELADNAFFEALTRQTLITMEAPPPPRTSCDDPCSAWGPVGFGLAGSTASFDRSGGGPPVMVFHQGVIGPYETATVGSEDPDALLTWMNEHGYVVDDSMLPTIRHYVDQGMNFAVLRLRAGESVDRMQPVRVTVPGLSTSLPLRMVAAGAGVDLSLELFVFAESRMETANFGNAEVDRAAIAYDWASATFDYEARFEDALFAGEGPTTNWVTEYAQPIGSWSSLESYTVRDEDDGEIHTAQEDVLVVRRALPTDAYLTRLRTRLTPNDLRTDLNLRMSGAGDVGTFINVTRELNRAPDPVCSDYCASGDGIDPGGSTTRGTGRSFRCSASAGAGRAPLGLGLLGLGLFVASRRRRGRAS